MVARHTLAELRPLRRRRELAIEEEVADPDEIAFLGQLVDRIAAVEKDALVAVDEGDLGIRSSRSRYSLIVCEHPVSA